MTTLRFLGVTTLAIAIMAPDAMAQRRGGGGGAVRGGMRGAMVGGMVGGSSGAQTGAKVGVVAGATRGVAERTADRRAMDSETQSRTEYESSDEYANTEHSNFDEAPPEVLATSQLEEPATKGGEAVIEKDGKPILGITYPSNWNQKVGENSVSAISAKGNAWSMLATLDGAKDKQAGIDKIKKGLEKYLTNIKYDEPTKTEKGALLLTGTGKAKKAGIDVVFATGVTEAAPGQLAGVAFVVDKNVEDHYKEAVRYICKTILVEKDFTHEVAKPVSSNK